MVTQLSLTTLSDRLAQRLLLLESTTPRNLEHEPLQVLICSAFWIDADAVGTTLTVLAVVAVMVPAERWLGTRRWLAVFAAGHLGATLATAGVTAVAVGLKLLAGLPEVVDVGVSYGLLAVAGVLTFRWASARVRWAWAVTGLVLLGTLVTVDEAAVDIGHLIAFLIGLGSWPLIRRGRPVRAQEGSSESPLTSPWSSGPPVGG
jgi:hypothetical protein